MTTLNQDLNATRKEIRDGMDEILKEKGLSLNSASSTDIGRALTEFYVKRIAFHTDALTDIDAIDRGLECDGKNDLGVDFIYEKPEDNEFWIYQSKYKGKSSSLPREEMANFVKIHTRLFDFSARSSANRAVTESLQNLDKKSSVTFIFLTNVQASDESKKEFERLRASETKVDGTDNYDWKFIDLSQIKADIKQVLSAKEQPPLVEIPIRSSKGNKQYIELSDEIHRDGKEYKTIITVISGTTLNDLCKRYRSSLFNYNIRGFLGNKSKNKKIRDTLEQEPEFFYLYNNGISAICSDLHITPGKNTIAQCKNFQIINGAQTAGSIGSFGKLPDSAQNLKKVMILLRITKTEKTKSEKGLNKKIITSNNTQNVIRDADFRSNDLVQIALQRIFSAKKFQYKVSKPYRTLMYHPKRSDIPNATKKDLAHISMEDMAKSLYAFLKDDPSKLNSQSKFLFTEDAGSYWHLFGKDGEEVDTVDEATAKQFAAISMLKIYLDALLKQGAKSETVDTLEGMAYRSGRHFLWAFGYVVRTFYSPDEQKKIYDKIVSGSAFEEGKFVPSWYEYIFDAIHTALSIDSDDSDQSGKTLNFKMWLRNKDKVQIIMKRLKFIKKNKSIPPA